MCGDCSCREAFPRGAEVFHPELDKGDCIVDEKLRGIFEAFDRVGENSVKPEIVRSFHGEVSFGVYVTARYAVENSIRHIVLIICQLQFIIL
jgi:hypothetical protein